MESLGTISTKVNTNSSNIAINSQMISTINGTPSVSLTSLTTAVSNNISTAQGNKSLINAVSFQVQTNFNANVAQ